MAQTKDRKRLLWKGKPVGFEKKEYCEGYSCLTWQSKDGVNWYRLCPDVSFDADSSNNIRHDSFEQGIEFDGQWWFDGDRLEDCREMNQNTPLQAFSYGKGTVVYKGGVFMLNWDDERYGDLLLYYSLSDFKRIGNIHEVNNE